MSATVNNLRGGSGSSPLNEGVSVADMAMMNARQCSFCEDGSLMFFNNATSLGSSNLLVL